jgi:hypothetical protein
VLRRIVREPVRDVDFGARLETFFVAAVATVLVIRTQLWLTNYPQLGGHGLHIAHLLYGGIFMVLAIGLLLTFLNRSIRTPAAIVGGVGFGFFIDELGKFITSDNNYFFEPAAALIYLVFVGLFLTIHALQRRRGLTPEESVANAVALLASAATGDLDERGRRRALDLLDRGDPGDPLVTHSRALLGEISALPAKAPSRADQLAVAARERYLELVDRRGFITAVCCVIGLWGGISLVATFELVLSVAIERGGDADLSFINLATLASSTVSGVLVVVGIRRLLRRDREGAYRDFERALLVSIFVTRTFVFVESQFGAVFGLAIDLALLLTLRRMAASERPR